MNASLYMLIDTTVLDSTRIIAVADLQRSIYMGRLLHAEGRKIIAPALEGRGFAKLEHLQLQYLFWNTFGERPNDDYGILVKDCLEKAKAMEADKTDLDYLERMVARLEETQIEGQSKAEANAADGQPIDRPRRAGATLQVWEIADSLNKGEPKNPKEFRKAVIDECVRRGINASTASTQFSKWSKSKCTS